MESQGVNQPEDNHEELEEQISDMETHSINEKQLMTRVMILLQGQLHQQGLNHLTVTQGAKLTYALEVVAYDRNGNHQQTGSRYETDLLVYENLDDSRWKPRVVIEGKLGSVTTHDAITYSQKALTHKNVHPYVRYGILLGNRKHYPLPGRLFRHGAYFDFMLSFVSVEPSAEELDDLARLIVDEVEASKNLEEILYNSRNPKRKRYTVLHRPLRLK